MTEDEAAAELDAIASRHYAEGDVTRKHRSYFEGYAHLLAHRREEPLRILELGVSSGASLLIWRDFLPNAQIVGIDIAEMPERVRDQPRIHLLQGSQDDPAILDRAGWLAGGGFDLIIDDASHIGFLTKRSLVHLFPRWLVPGGHYVIEDIGTGFMPEYPDGIAFEAPPWADAVAGTKEFPSSQFGMIGVAKQLLDHMMQPLATGEPSYLPIDSLSMTANIVFVRKGTQPGAAAPGALPGGDFAGPGSLWGRREQILRQLAQLESVPERLEAVGGTVDGLIGTVGELSGALGGLTSSTGEVEGRVSRLGGRLDEAETTVNVLARELGSQGERLTALETVVGRALARLGGVRRVWGRLRGG
ncbi:MAG: hypothetical protein BGO51_08875 [Rhodospirillales bacterium 69-11]|mgnify:CR=1 FL=1|nr:hypothetical protein [Rhodospirillales bacterium]OJW26040.1 MAG: hypothetical protein BGO51_08875 [Rhodospirillales bacterium 69-11]